MASLRAAFMVLGLRLGFSSGPGCPGPFSIVDFGAVGDAETVNTGAVQAAIAAAAACPYGGRVLVPFSASNSSTFVSNAVFLDDRMSTCTLKLVRQFLAIQPSQTGRVCGAPRSPALASRAC